MPSSAHRGARRHHRPNSSVSTIRQAETERPGLEPLTRDLQAEFVKPAGRAQVRAHDWSAGVSAGIR
jgi:hypothetical protein